MAALFSVSFWCNANHSDKKYMKSCIKERDYNTLSSYLKALKNLVITCKFSI
jgi:hypothetical protein